MRVSARLLVTSSGLVGHPDDPTQHENVTESRREDSLDTHVPDPIVARADGSDPEQEAEMADSVGLALLVVLDTYLDNPVRQDLWRAGHPHAGVLLVLALVMLRYVDETRLSGPGLWLARHGVPVAAILVPAGFFLSIIHPAATEPNALIALVAAGGLSLVGGVLTLGIGLLRAPDR